MHVSLHHFTSQPDKNWRVAPAVIVPADGVGRTVFFLDLGEDATSAASGTVTIYFRDLADAQAFEDKIRSAVRQMEEKCGKGPTPTKPSRKAVTHATA